MAACKPATKGRKPKKALTDAELLDKVSSAFMEMTQYSDDIDDGLAQWQAERVALVEFHEENYHLKNILGRVWEIVEALQDLDSEIEKANGLFLPPSVKGKLDRFREAKAKLDANRKQADDVESASLTLAYVLKPFAAGDLKSITLSHLEAARSVYVSLGGKLNEKRKGSRK